MARGFNASILRHARAVIQSSKRIITMANRSIHSLKRWRTIWGILTLLSLAFICYGLTASANAFTKTTAGNTSDAYQAGAFLGAGAGSLIYLDDSLLPEKLSVKSVNREWRWFPEESFCGPPAAISFFPC